MSSADKPDGPRLLDGERIALVGKFAGMSKRDVRKLVRAQGAVTSSGPSATDTLIVVGEADLPLGDLVGAEELFDEPTRRAAEQGTLTLITETQLWERLGLVDPQQASRRLYTPAMVADLLDVPVAVVRRWHRKGVIVPVREVRRLPYFDFREVATARRLADLLAAGCSPLAIEKKLAELAKFVPGVDRPLAQLTVIVEGKQLLFRSGGALSEPGGQLRFDFDAAAGTGELPLGETDAPILPLSRPADSAPDVPTPAAMFSRASDLEEQGCLPEAAEMYRAVLTAAGPDAQVNFLLAELLYRLGDIAAARERYYAAIEQDEHFIEARANLGCVLAETGQLELAVAAFEGALALHCDYPDAHYHLARTLDDLGKTGEAEAHWHAFLALVPDSPWADEARDRLARATVGP